MTPFFAKNNAKNDSQIILKENNDIESDPMEVANILNDHFIDFTKEINDTQMNSCDLHEIIQHHESHLSVASINSESQADCRFEFEAVSYDNILKQTNQQVVIP